MISDKVTSFLAQQYAKRVAYELNQVGLRYEDLILETQPAFEEALEYAPKDVIEARTRRLKRAIDLSYKRKSLLDYAPNAVCEPFKVDLVPIIEKINQRDQEYTLYNMHNK